IYNPFTHTGMLAATQLTPAWSVQAALVLGSDVFIDPAAEPTFMGRLQWAPPDQPASPQRDTVTFNVIVGSGRFNRTRDFSNPNLFDLIWTHKFNPQWLYTFETTFSYQTDVPDLGTTPWLGVVQYLTYEFTPRLKGTGRLEFFDDFQGQRTGFRGLY